MSQNKDIEEVENNLKNYLNKKSWKVFYVMLGLILCSVAFAIYQGITRKEAEYTFEDVSGEIGNDLNSDIATFQQSYSKYSSLKEKEKELDSLLAKDSLTLSDTIRIKKLVIEIKNINNEN